MARSRSLEVLQDIFPNRAVISATDAGKAISLAPQTVKNQVSAGNFPIPTFLIGGKRICRLTDVADYIENIGKRPGRPRGSTKDELEHSLRRTRACLHRLRAAQHATVVRSWCRRDGRSNADTSLPVKRPASPANRACSHVHGRRRPSGQG